MHLGLLLNSVQKKSEFHPHNLIWTPRCVYKYTLIRGAAAVFIFILFQIQLRSDLSERISFFFFFFFTHSFFFPSINSYRLLLQRSMRCQANTVDLDQTVMESGVINKLLMNQSLIRLMAPRHTHVDDTQNRHVLLRQVHTLVLPLLSCSTWM